MKALQMIRPKAGEVERLEAELAKLNAEGAALCAKIEDLTVREGEVEDAGEMIRAMADSRAAQNKLRRIDAEIAEVREKLAIARDAVRAKLRAELLATFQSAASDFIAKARAAQEAAGRTIAARQAFEDAGFGIDFQRLPFLPSFNGAALLLPDLLDNFEAALNPEPIAKLKAIAAPRPAVIETPAPAPVPAPKREKRVARRETAGEGERLFLLLRGLVELPRKGTIQAGDVVALTTDEAQPLILNGAGDWVSDDQVAQIDASTAVDQPKAEEAAQ